MEDARLHSGLGQPRGRALERRDHAPTLHFQNEQSSIPFDSNILFQPFGATTSEPYSGATPSSSEFRYKAVRLMAEM